jgi:hypothetical protein
MKRFLATVLVFGMAMAGCVNDPNKPMTHGQRGALIGAIGGAVLGAVAYKKNRTKGAVVGAVGGGLAGAAVGTYMDSQKRDLERNLAPEIQAGQARGSRDWSRLRILADARRQRSAGRAQGCVRPRWRSLRIDRAKYAQRNRSHGLAPRCSRHD